MKFGSVLLLFAGLLWPALLPEACGQTIALRGTVVDAVSGQPLAFATLRASGSDQGAVADIDGRFSWAVPAGTAAIQCSHLGYETATVPAPAVSTAAFSFRLQPAGASLGEVLVRPPYDKIRRLLQAAIAHRAEHNPELLPQYSCNIYYKMAVDMDFAALADDSAERVEMQRVTAEQHLLVAETYSRRYWQHPAALHEDIVATRFSGLERAAFTNLVTDVLPFHVQGDFIRLNERDYPNPVAKGYEAGTGSTCPTNFWTARIRSGY